MKQCGWFAIPESYTGAAYIFVEEASGDNAIIVCPGAAGDIDVAMVEQNSDLIADHPCS